MTCIRVVKGYNCPARAYVCLQLIKESAFPDPSFLRIVHRGRSCVVHRDVVPSVNVSRAIGICMIDEAPDLFMANKKQMKFNENII